MSFTSERLARQLEESRVDLLAVIDAGIPEREWVPGSRMFMRGCRYLLPGGAGSCKSLSMLTHSVDMVDAGATVAILDVENGANEYARRLADILADRPASARDSIQARLRYYAWPTLSLEWAAQDWARALAVDVVVFDSSRLALSSVGLSEDKSDEYARFVNALVVPLARAGITPVILDNVGHDDKGRARGTSAKRDLCEVEYAVARHGRVDHDHAGKVEFKLGRSRFPEQPDRLVMTIGAGTYSAITVENNEQQGDWRPTVLIGRLIDAARANPGQSRSALCDLTKGNRARKLEALTFAVADGYLEDRGKQGIHYLRDLDEDAQVPSSQPVPGTFPEPASEVPFPFPGPNTGNEERPEENHPRHTNGHAYKQLPGEEYEDWEARVTALIAEGRVAA